MSQKITLQAIAPLTHDTWHLTFGRPDGFDFDPGQAAELTFKKDGIPKKGRPFTMTSQPDAPSLEFVIKSYSDHDDGVTQHVADLNVGDTAELDGPFGAITDHGRGVFLAAGAGITPFIGLLKKHDREGVSGDTLIFSNKTDGDIIMRETWTSLSGVTPHFFVTDQPDTNHQSGMIDQSSLTGLISDLDQPFYICGPGGFVDAMRDALRAMDVADDCIITEEGW